MGWGQAISNALLFLVFFIFYFTVLTCIEGHSCSMVTSLFGKYGEVKPRIPTFLSIQGSLMMSPSQQKIVRMYYCTVLHILYCDTRVLMRGVMMMMGWRKAIYKEFLIEINTTQGIEDSVLHCDCCSVIFLFFLRTTHILKKSEYQSLIMCFNESLSPYYGD